MNIIFPELQGIVSEIQVKSVYQIMSEYPETSLLAKAHLTRLTNLLSKNSKGHYGREKALEIREAAKNSIGSSDSILSFELKQTLARIKLLQEQIQAVEQHIKEIIYEVT